MIKKHLQMWQDSASNGLTNIVEALLDPDAAFLSLFGIDYLKK